MSLFNRLFDKKPTPQPEAAPKATPAPQPVAKPSAKATVSATKPEAAEKVNPKKAPSEAAPNLQSVPWRTFSIFISSTFADMQAERDHLKNIVFPKVEEELQQRRIMPPLERRKAALVVDKHFLPQ